MGALKARASSPAAAGALLLAAALALAGCGHRGVRAAHRAEWDTRWPALARSGPRLRNGAELTLITREGRPEGVRTTRDRWLLLRRDSLGGDFEVRRAALPARVAWLPFHPAVPAVPMRPGRSSGLYPYGGGLVAVTVPAGRFRCGRTWRTLEERDGAVMRVDEWWAPGIPVPVQRWTRWEGVVDTLYAPPRRAADVRVGTEWAVLERIRQP